MLSSRSGTSSVPLSVWRLHSECRAERESRKSRPRMQSDWRRPYRSAHFVCPTKIRCEEALLDSERNGSRGDNLVLEPTLYRTLNSAGAEFVLFLWWW